MDEDKALNDVVQDVAEQAEQEAPVQDEPTQEAQGADHTQEVIKKRLGQMAKRHEKELREHRRMIDTLQARLAQAEPVQTPFAQPGQPDPMPATEEDRIKQAVMYALTAKERQEQERIQQERHAHVAKQYERLRNEFDNAYEKYPDFDEKVRDDSAPFTEHMRDALLLIDNPVDVAYRLADKRDELQRIARLHPLDQAREINRLSRALERGQAQAAQPQTGNRVNPIGNLRANPAGGAGVTDKTSAAAIRMMMKNGTWK